MRTATRPALGALARSSLVGRRCRRRRLRARRARKKPDKITQELLTQPKEVALREGQGAPREEEVRRGPQVPEPRLRDVSERARSAARRCCWSRTPTSSRRPRPAYTEARYRYRDYLNRYPGAPQPRLRPLPVRPLLRQGAREARPGPDGDPGGDRAVPGPDPRVPGLGLRGRRPGADPPAHRPAGRARLRGRLLLPAQGLDGRGPVAVHPGRAAVPGLRGQGQALLLPGRCALDRLGRKDEARAVLREGRRGVPRERIRQESASPRSERKAARKAPDGRGSG